MFQLYTLDILAHISFFLSIIYVFHISTRSTLRADNKIYALLLCIFTALMLGLSDIGYDTQSDRDIYAQTFKQISETSWSDIFTNKEWLFYGYMKFTNFLENPQLWLILTASIYVFNYYAAAKRIAPKNVYLLMLLIICAFSFRGYGTNTIRAGLALSFVFWGLAHITEKWKWLIYFFIAFNIHHSTTIPIFAALISKYLPQTKYSYYFWFISVILSAVAGSYFTELFAIWGADFDNRTDYLTTTESQYNLGFRIDFILYSFLPIIAGYYYQHNLKFKNQFYSIIYNTYIIANAFWILVIKANFSDRFAYLSWFLYALVLIYPFLNNPKHFKFSCNKYIVKIILVISLFSYFMYWKYL